MLAILTVVYALNLLDRTIFNVRIEPIKKEFVLSDTTMGLLAGFGFVLFYSLLDIPIARITDRLNRRNIVAIAFAFWSAMTALCGMAGTLIGGLVVAQVSKRDDRWKLWAPAIMSGLAGPVFAACMLTQDFKTMVAVLALTSFLVGFHLGPIFAIAQTVAKPSMRALASAIIHLCRALDSKRHQAGILS